MHREFGVISISSMTFPDISSLGCDPLVTSHVSGSLAGRDILVSTGQEVYNTERFPGKRDDFSRSSYQTTGYRLDRLA